MSNTRFFRRIHEGAVPSYVNAGWEVNPSIGLPNGSVQVSRTLITQRTGDDNRDVSLKQPYLIQRATIRRPLGMYSDKTVGEAIEFDYMGAAEFEFGALAYALRVIQSQFPLYKMHVVEQLSEEVQGRTYNLRVFANFDNDEQKAQYVDWLTQMKAGKLYMKEDPQFKLVFGNDCRPDVWFDINNGIFFSFDKQFMSRLTNHLTASFSNLDTKVRS